MRQRLEAKNTEAMMDLLLLSEIAAKVADAQDLLERHLGRDGQGWEYVFGQGDGQPGQARSSSLPVLKGTDSGSWTPGAKVHLPR